MEDRHFHSYPSAIWEWDYGPNDSGHLDKGGADRGVEGSYRDWVGKMEMVIKFLSHIANLQYLFTEIELPLNGHELLHDLHNPSLSIFHQPLQSILEVAQSPITIDFPMVLGVINLGKCHIDGEFPFIPAPQVCHDTTDRGLTRLESFWD